MTKNIWTLVALEFYIKERKRKKKYHILVHKCILFLGAIVMK